MHRLTHTCLHDEHGDCLKGLGEAVDAGYYQSKQLLIKMMQYLSPNIYLLKIAQCIGYLRF